LADATAEAEATGIVSAAISAALAGETSEASVEVDGAAAAASEVVSVAIADALAGMVTDEDTAALKVQAIIRGRQARAAAAGRAIDAFDALDVDGDGKLDMHELGVSAAEIAALDIDGDGKLSREEVAQAESRGGGGILSNLLSLIGLGGYNAEPEPSPAQSPETNQEGLRV